MFSTWMAFASMVFQLGLILALVLCCVLVNIFISEFKPVFSSTVRNRIIALTGGVIIAVVLLFMSFEELGAIPFTEMTILATMIGFFGKFAVATFAIYFSLEWMNRKN